MVFGSPIWLIGLLPWLAVAIYCLLGQRRREDVPFLELWEDLKGPKPRHRRFVVPPASVILGLLAALVGLLAASRPAWLSKSPDAQQICLIIDRGITMSARGRAEERYKELANAAAADLLARFDRRVSVRVVTVPPGSDAPQPRTIDLAEIPDDLKTLLPTAKDSSGEINQAVLDQLARGARLVVAVTDHDLTVDEHVIRVAPENPPANVGIRLLAARQTPTTQVMVSVRNDSNQASAVVELRSGAYRGERSIPLAAKGQSQNHFFYLPSLAGLLGCRVVVDDDLPADNAAVLARSRRWPRLDVAGSVGEPLLRMIESYQRQRPAGADSTTIVIARDLATAGDRPAVIVAPIVTPARGGISPSTGPSQLVMVNHPVTANLPADALEGKLLAALSPPEGFEPVLKHGEQTLVAVRAMPRQVWVGFDSEDFAARPAFVVLWTNIFNWVGAGGDTFSAFKIEQIEDTWRLEEASAGTYAPRLGPGVYERLDGSLAAVNAVPVDLPAPGDTNWKTRLDAMDLKRITSRRDLSPWLLLGALGLLVLALAAWPSSRV